ncbi:MAG: hypothetical protein HN379_08160 [Desulfobacteraceae bacterium]|nr:hypothetical protein [Desulfobacteraceae bacterium]
MERRYGYSGKILQVDLSSGNIDYYPTEKYSSKFLGGRGIAAAIHWDEVPPEAKAFDPENKLVMMTGPLCGIKGLAGSRWQISGKSPVHNRFSYCNLGGAWGARLKFAGYDGLVISGKSDKPVYLYIDNENIELRDASFLMGMGAAETRRKLKDDMGKLSSVLSIGPAGESRAVFATIMADSDSSGSAGMGAVMGSKNIKAIAVRGKGSVDIADNERLGSLRQTVRKLKYNLTHYPTTLSSSAQEGKLKRDICFGCVNGCVRETYTPKGKPTGKYMCQSAIFYDIRAHRYYGEATEVPFFANNLCDDFGLDTRALETMIMWLVRCYKSGILTEEETDLPFSKIGSLEFIEKLIRMISFRKGFGDVLANGTIKAAEIVGQESDKLITSYMVKTGENELYGPRLYITTGLFYAMEPRQPIQQLHEVSEPGIVWATRELGAIDHYLTSDVMRGIGKRFWGSEIAADFSTYEGKALAASMVQNREYAKEMLIVCDFTWPIIHSPGTDDHVGDPSLESRICEAVTGVEMTESGLYHLGERVFNLQRAILAREGHNGRSHDILDEYNFTAPLKGDYGNPDAIVPGKGGKPFARKGMVVDRDEFEKMKDEYYEIRGWDVATGLQKKECLEKLDLGDVANALETEGLIV